jgi:hypothetical protein
MLDLMYKDFYNPNDTNSITNAISKLKLNSTNAQDTSLIEFMELSLQDNITARPTISNLKKHPFLNLESTIKNHDKSEKYLQPVDYFQIYKLFNSLETLQPPSKMSSKVNVIDILPHLIYHDMEFEQQARRSESHESRIYSYTGIIEFSKFPEKGKSYLEFKLSLDNGSISHQHSRISKFIQESNADLPHVRDFHILGYYFLNFGL